MSLDDFETEISLEKALTSVDEALTREKEEFENLGIEGVLPFLQVLLIAKNKILSSFLCVELLNRKGELIFKAANPVNNFSVDQKIIEKITRRELVEAGGKFVYLNFRLTGGMKSQVCISREIIE